MFTEDDAFWASLKPDRRNQPVPVDPDDLYPFTRNSSKRKRARPKRSGTNNEYLLNMDTILEGNAEDVVITSPSPCNSTKHRNTSPLQPPTPLFPSSIDTDKRHKHPVAKEPRKQLNAKEKQVVVTFLSESKHNPKTVTEAEISSVINNLISQSLLYDVRHLIISCMIRLRKRE